MEPSPYFHRTPPPDRPLEAEATPILLEQEEPSLDLRRYIIPVRRHLRLILAIFVAAVVVTALKVSMMTPIYTATTTILMGPVMPAEADPVTAMLAVEASWDPQQYFQTQVQIMRSPSLAARVISRLGLAHNPSFAGSGRPPGFLSSLSAGAIGWARGLFSPLAPAPQRVAGGAERAPAGEPVKVSPALVGAYLGALSVAMVPNTSLVRISFSSPSPELAARIANEHARAYVRQGIELHSQSSMEAERFLQEKLVSLRDKLEKSETALNAYRRAKGIIPGLTSLSGKDTVVLDRLSVLSRDLTQAQVAQLGLQAQIEAMRKRHYSSLPQVMDNPMISALETRLNGLYAQQASLASQFKPDYPPLAELDAKIAATRSQLNSEVNRVISGLDAQYAEASAKVKNLQAEMDRQRTRTLKLNDAAVQYAILAREVDTNRQLYDAVLKRMKDLGFAAQSESSNVSIVNPAEPPLVASSPRKTRAVTLAGGIGFAAGIGLAFLLEYLDNTIKGPDEVESYLHLPNLGVVPEFSHIAQQEGATRALKPAELAEIEAGPPGGGRGVKDLPGAPGDAPTAGAARIGRELVTTHGFYSMLGEAYRNFRTALLLSRAGAPPKVTLVTSALDSEGKTITAINTAIMLAQFGTNVLLVDADLRRARCHRVLAVENHLGLTEVLTGSRELADIIRPTNVDHLFLLSSGSMPPNPNELLGSQKMHQTLTRLQEQYDYIVIDSPPVIPVSDAVLLSRMVDGVVLVVDGSRTPKQQVKLAVSRLEYARAKIFGVVLNKVRIHSSSYYYYGHYYGNYYAHYASNAPDDDRYEQAE